MPTLLSVSDLDALQRRIQGATKERMLREMAEALEVLTTERPLVLVLEDLHWSDYATLDLIAFLARRREPARLLLIGTYRAAEVTLSGHPLRAVMQELHMHWQCEELPVGPLSEAAVAAYLGARFPVRGQRTVPLQELARRIHQRTDGNPLFMVNVVDYLVAQGLVVHCDGQWELKGGIGQAALKVPESIRRMIEKQIDHLNVGEQRVLEVASVAGAHLQPRQWRQY
jgi:predicted ATPase